MRSYSKLLCIVLLLTLVALGAGCSKLKARDQLNKGVLAYKNGDLQRAIEHFKQAVELDPTLLNARLYLATGYSSLFMPGVETEENFRNAEAAISVYKQVLETEPKNVNSVGGIAYLNFQMKKLEEAKKWYRREIEMDPSNAEAYYSVGVIDWTQTYEPRMKVKSEHNLQPDELIKDAKIRNALCETSLPLIEESFQNLNKAIELRPSYEDAMIYLNLMYREKADCEADSSARAEDLKKADGLMQKVMDMRKAKAEGAAQPVSQQ